MQIQLKQSEIETALKDFIQKQGIQLQNRAVTIEFTSGRKENGITADLSISDLSGDFPALLADEEPTATLSLVGGTGDAGADLSPAQSLSVQPVDNGQLEAAPVKSSLFGG